VLLSEIALLLIRNDLNRETQSPQSKANAVNGIPSLRLSSKKVAHVNGHRGDERPQCLNVPEGKEFPFVVSEGVETIVFSSLLNVMQITENKRVMLKANKLE
jgi:hypothetical protein